MSTGHGPLTVTCIPPSFPTPPPSVAIPHFGTLQKAWSSLSGVPDAGDLLCQLQDVLALAMAPVRRYLEMVEGIYAIKQCMTVIPDAISTLDVDALWNCLKTLVQTLARILAWMPPFSYIATAVDIVGYCLDLIDEILSFMQRVDAKITSWIEIYDLAEQAGDLELIEFVNCGIAQTKVDIRMMMDTLQFIAPINDALIENFMRMMNLEALKPAYEKYTQASQYYGQVATAIESGAASLPALAGFTPPSKTQHVIVPVPPLGALFENMGRSYNAGVTLYNLLAPFVGREANKEMREIPTFDNF